ncbi:MAG TPA: 4-hydroxythreonine-4-phosphate dehydrogenase PdxA [Candidatus Omnitrophota bacterium]|nr:4-hydroxythreonine-4-phosphate dehydrogenase PdxA [Candidatus Omnitrophota bacterium]
MKSKLIAVTMGDPGGIGAEIVLKALRQRLKQASFLVIGSKQALDLAEKKLRFKLPFTDFGKEDPSKPNPSLYFKDVDADVQGKIQPGKLALVNGAKALAAVQLAERLARTDKVTAIVTAPLNKTAVRLSCPSFVGHTEFLAKKARIKKYAMMFVGSRFLVTLATIHVPLKKVSSLITQKLLLEKIELTAGFLKRYQFSKRDVAVCALNPHGKETGNEEDRVIVPALKAARKRGYAVSGPHPGDSVFYDAYHGKFGAVLAMYHDQALAPFKMISFRDGVNVTLGLPYLRTSPDHGTAFDIAYQGRADESSFLSAVDLVLKLRSLA